MSDCCHENNNNKKGICYGLLCGLLPHSFCIAFVIFSIAGAAGATALAKKFLLIPHFFLFLVIISFLFATISAFIYLRRTDCLSRKKIKNKWKYLSILYGATVAVNIIVIFVIFPSVINLQPAYASNQLDRMSMIDIEVAIPCSGHAPLIIYEIKKDPGVESVNFQMPNVFKIIFNPARTSAEKITALSIFETFKLKPIK